MSLCTFVNIFLFAYIGNVLFITFIPSHTESRQLDKASTNDSATTTKFAVYSRDILYSAYSNRDRCDRRQNQFHVSDRKRASYKASIEKVSHTPFAINISYIHKDVMTHKKISQKKLCCPGWDTLWCWTWEIKNEKKFEVGIELLNIWWVLKKKIQHIIKVNFVFKTLRKIGSSKLINYKVSHPGQLYTTFLSENCTGCIF